MRQRLEACHARRVLRLCGSPAGPALLGSMYVWAEPRRPRPRHLCLTPAAQRGRPCLGSNKLLCVAGTGEAEGGGQYRHRFRAAASTPACVASTRVLPATAAVARVSDGVPAAAAPGLAASGQGLRVAAETEAAAARRRAGRQAGRYWPRGHRAGGGAWVRLCRGTRTAGQRRPLRHTAGRPGHGVSHQRGGHCAGLSKLHGHACTGVCQHLHLAGSSSCMCDHNCLQAAIVPPLCARYDGRVSLRVDIQRAVCTPAAPRRMR
jgi:hypothetical protein